SATARATAHEEGALRNVEQHWFILAIGRTRRGDDEHRYVAHRGGLDLCRHATREVLQSFEEVRVPEMDVGAPALEVAERGQDTGRGLPGSRGGRGGGREIVLRRRA